MKVYNSFEEIDKDLKILRLQTEIDMEEIKLSLDQAKDGFSPLSIIGNTVGNILQKALILKTISKVFGVKHVVTSSKK